MVLRELYETEKLELEKIEFTKEENGYKVLLALVAIDLMGDKVYDSYLKYESFIAYIDNGKYHEGEGFVLVPILETWLIKMAMNNEIAIDKRMEKNIYVLTICFINTICGISPGISGKKYRDMIDLYNEIKSDIQLQTGGDIDDYPEINYRYIVSCLEYMGLQRVPKLLNDMVDMRNIYYNDLFE